MKNKYLYLTVLIAAFSRSVFANINIGNFIPEGATLASVNTAVGQKTLIEIGKSGSNITSAFCYYNQAARVSGFKVIDQTPSGAKVIYNYETDSCGLGINNFLVLREEEANILIFMPVCSIGNGAQVRTFIISNDMNHVTEIKTPWYSDDSVYNISVVPMKIPDGKVEQVLVFQTWRVLDDFYYFDGKSWLSNFNVNPSYFLNIASQTGNINCCSKNGFLDKTLCEILQAQVETGTNDNLQKVIDTVDKTLPLLLKYDASGKRTLLLYKREALAKEGKMEAALRAPYEIDPSGHVTKNFKLRNPNLRVAGYIELAEFFAKNGDITEANQMLLEANQVTNTASSMNAEFSKRKMRLWNSFGIK